MVILRRLTVERIDRVSDQRAGGGDRYRLIQYWSVVDIQVSPMLARIVEGNQFMPPFSKSDQQGKQHCANQEPGRNRDVDGDSASHRT